MTTFQSKPCGFLRGRRRDAAAADASISADVRAVPSAAAAIEPDTAVMIARGAEEVANCASIVAISAGVVANSASMGAFSARVPANSASVAAISAGLAVITQIVGPDCVVMCPVTVDRRKKTASQLLKGSTQADIGGSFAACGDTIQQDFCIDAALGLHASGDK